VICYLIIVYRKDMSMSMVRSLGHLLLSAIFVLGGSIAFISPGSRVDTVAKAGIPEPETAVKLNGAAMVVGGTMLGIEIAPRLASLLLLGTMIPTTFVGHPFWQEEDKQRYLMHRTQFLKNLGLMGGLLLVLFEKD
jgi:putative oxidoreductase